MALRQLRLLPWNSNAFFARYSSNSNPYHVKVGIPEFLNGIGNGVKTYAEKIEAEFGDLQNLLVARSMKLKKINVGGDPKVCRHSRGRGHDDEAIEKMLNDMSLIKKFE